MSIGASLLAARQNAGLSVDDVATATRIRATLIRAIEADQFDGCGGSTYARGHIRSIAAAVGLDPTPLVTEFNRSQGPAVVLPVHQILDRTEIAQRNRTGPNWTAAMLVTAVLLAAVAFVGLLTGEDDPSQQTATASQSSTATAAPPLDPAATEPPLSGATDSVPAPPAGEQSPLEPAASSFVAASPAVTAEPSDQPGDGAETPTSAPAPSPPASSSPAAASSAPVVAFSGVTLRISVTGARCWVKVTDVSGSRKALYEGVLERGEVKDFAAKSKISVIFGEASAVSLRVNGRDIGAPGGRGQVVNVAFVPGDPAAG